MPAGAPKQYHGDKVTKDLIDYIEKADDPIIEEFCLTKGNPCKETLYRIAKECKELSNAIKRCHEKQMLRTQRLAEKGEINTTFAIFKLKQPCYGWTDKQVVESTNKNVELELSEEENKAEVDKILQKHNKK